MFKNLVVFLLYPVVFLSNVLAQNKAKSIKRPNIIISDDHPY